MADAVALAQGLIRCPSVTPAEAGALDCLERVLRPAGFAVERPVFSQAGTPDVENLFATIGRGAPHLVFAGHTDVVPPGDAARWTHGPFAGDVADGLLYGRGAVDMKGGLAAMLAAALDHLAAHGMARGTLSFLIAGDEEGPAINGTAKLLAFARERGHRFSHCLLAEPTSGAEVGDTLKIGRRGSLSGTLVVAGRQGHVAYPHKADNPARRLVAILDWLMSSPLDNGTAHFDASNLEIVSIDTGNPAFNVIPAEMRARFNVRFNDRWTSEALRAEIIARALSAAPADAFRIDWEPGHSESFLAAPGPFVDLVSDAVASVTGRRPDLSTAGGTSDARFVKDHCPVIELGLVGSTMHQIDEATPVADLERLAAIYRTILARYFAT